MKSCRNELKLVRIFISSPGDVVEERNQAKRVIERLQLQYPDVVLEPVLWEEMALEATESVSYTHLTLPTKA